MLVDFGILVGGFKSGSVETVQEKWAKSEWAGRGPPSYGYSRP